MLVLSRRIGEKLVIGDQITVTINRVSGNRVSLGIEAPPHVRVVRSELQKALLDVLNAEDHLPTDHRTGEGDSHSGNASSETAILTASMACR
jgi:carbon storage regulator CsrA